VVVKTGAKAASIQQGSGRVIYSGPNRRYQKRLNILKKNSILRYAGNDHREIFGRLVITKGVSQNKKIQVLYYVIVMIEIVKFC
jgi:hypothetical protein